MKRNADSTYLKGYTKFNTCNEREAPEDDPAANRTAHKKVNGADASSATGKELTKRGLPYLLAPKKNWKGGAALGKEEKGTGQPLTTTEKRRQKKTKGKNPSATGTSTG